jgi:hypothetical protein
MNNNDPVKHESKNNSPFGGGHRGRIYQLLKHSSVPLLQKTDLIHQNAEIEWKEP